MSRPTPHTHRPVLLLALLLAACPGDPGGNGDGGTRDGGGDTDAGPDPIEGLDLAVVALTAPDEGTEGGPYQVTFVVENLGTLDVDSAAVRLTLGLVGETPGTVHQGTVGPLAPGRMEAVTVDGTFASPLVGGTYVWIAEVDVPGDEAQSNDTRQAVVTLNGSLCNPDPYEDDDTQGAAQPIGIGTIQTHNFCDDRTDWFRFPATAGEGIGLRMRLARGEAIGWFVLEPDGTTQLTASFMDVTEVLMPEVSGDHYLLVELFSPSDEGAGTDYTVALVELEPDLLPNWVSSPDTVPVGGVMAVSVSAHNDGFAAVGPSRTGIYLSTDALIEPTDTLLATGMHPAIAIDEFHDLLVWAPVPETFEGAYFVGAILNDDRGVTEFDYANNASEARAVTIEALSGCTVDANEQDDHPGAAVPLSVDAVVSLNHCDDFHDWLELSLTEGVEYSLMTEPVPRSRVAPEIWVYADDGVTELVVEPSGLLHFLAPYTGTFYVNAADAWTSDTRPRTGEEHDYTFSFEERLPELSVSLTSIPWTTTVPQGVLEVDLQVENTGFSAAGAFRAGVYLSTDATVDTGDTLLASVDYVGLAPGAGPREELLVPIPAATTPASYTVGVVVDDLSAVTENDETNNVGRTVALTVEALACPADAYEEDDFQSQSQAVVLGTPQVRNHCDDEADWVHFDASAGDHLLVDVVGEMFVSPRQEIFDAAGVSLAGPASTIDDRLFYVAPTTGTYWARIGASARDYSSSGSQAGYILLVDRCAQDAFEDNELRTAAQPLAVPGSVSLNFCDDDADWFSFTAIGGTDYRIETSGLGARVDTRVGIWDDAGSRLANNDDINGGTRASRVDWTAPADGTYFIEVLTWDWGFDAGYTLSVQ